MEDVIICIVNIAVKIGVGFVTKFLRQQRNIMEIEIVNVIIK